MTSTTRTLREDLAFGLRHEHETLTQLREIFGGGLQRQRFKYAIYDFHNPETRTFVELKTRRGGIRHNTYPDTVIGYNKVQHVDLEEGDHYLLFKFADGIWGCKVDSKIQALEPTTFYRLNGEIKHNIKIPIEYLLPIEELC